MAEIILPPEEEQGETPQVPEPNIDKPTDNSKVITIEFEAKKTNKVSTKDTNQQLYTTDTDAWFEFRETSLEGANGTYSVVFRNGRDGSIFQRTGDVVNGVAYYKIPHQEIRHAGTWRGQIVYTLSNGDTTAREFDYDVKGHILDGKDVREIVVEDFETLMSQLRSMKENAELELANLTQQLKNTTDTAEQNETDRQVFFDDLVGDIDELQANYQELLDTGVLQTNINTKLEQLEEEYAPKLTEVTAQLAQTSSQLNQRVSETIATAGDGTVPSELTDMRVDGKGNRFDVAGDRLLNVENMLVNKKSEVRITWEKGGINTTDGALFDSPRSVRSVSYYNGSTNSYVAIPDGYNFYLHTFDENNNYLVGRRLYQNGGIYTLPLEKNKKYKFAFLDQDVHATPTVEELANLIKIEEEVDMEYLNDFAKKSDLPIQPIKDKVINVLGDSIASVDYVIPNWWQMIAEGTGATFNDYGWSGTTLTHTEDRHLWSSHFEKFPEGTEIGGCMVERYVNMDETADGVLVLGGRNDGDVPRGSWDSVDDSTLFGALNVLMVGLLQKFKGKPVIFMTPIQSRDEFATNVPNPTEQLLEKSDADTLTAQLRAEAIKLKCKQYSIPCVDLYNESGINGADGEHVYYRSSTDATHPSSSGQERIKNMVQPVLEKHFRQ